MHVYSIFGLTIHSEFALPSLLPGDGKADVVITRGTFTLPLLQEGLHGLWYFVTPETVYLRWEEAGYFRMHAGKEIIVDPDPDVPEHVLMRYIIGSVFGAILHQRGELALHASAVASPDGAIAFIGEAGWGKSTLAAHFHTREYQLITDDILAIRPSAHEHLVFPGFPEFKLWPDTLDALGEKTTELPEVFPGRMKRVRYIDSGMQYHPLPLKRIYVLAGGNQHEILPLSPAVAALQLVRHTYGVEVFHSIGPKQHFQQCTTLAQTVPIRLLRRRVALDEIPATIELIEEDMQSNSPIFV